MEEHFSLWQERCLAHKEAQEQARSIVHEFAKINADFLAMCQTKQSAPHHAEGPEVRDHILRALTFLFALQYEECSLGKVDEWHSAKHLGGFFERLQETCMQEKKMLQAYILAHDIGKKDTARSDETGWHYPMHAHQGADMKYADFREKVLNFSHCSPSEGKLLRELVRIHMQIITEMSHKKESRVLSSAAAIADRQGINTNRMLALLPAAFLLDAIGGSLDEGVTGFEKAQFLIRYAEREYEAFPQRKEEDELRAQRKKKEAYKTLREKWGLGPEEWFLRLNTPHGKERGKVVKILDRFIKGIEDGEDVRYVGEEHAHELRMRSAGLREKEETKS